MPWKRGARKIDPAPKMWSGTDKSECEDRPSTSAPDPPMFFCWFGTWPSNFLAV